MLSLGSNDEWPPARLNVISVPEFRGEEHATANDFCGASPPQIFGEFRLGLDKDAGPAPLFEIVGLRAFLRSKCADVDEIPVLDLTQKGLLEVGLNFLRKYRAHGSF